MKKLFFILVFLTCILFPGVIDAEESKNPLSTESVSRPPLKKPVLCPSPSFSPTEGTSVSPDNILTAPAGNPPADQIKNEDQDNYFQSVQQFQDWAEFFYLHPDPDHLVDAIKFIFRLRLHEAEDFGPTVSGLIAGIFHRYPERLEGWGEPLKCLTPDEKIFICFSLWLAGSPECSGGLKMLTDTLPDSPDKADLIARMETPAPPVTELPFVDVTVIDTLWGWFYATGDTGCIIRILSALDPDNDIQDDAIRMSLISNVADHDLVLKTLEDQLPYCSPDLVDETVSIIKQAKKARKDKTGPGK
ncbi:MAG: hypothetical protein M1269_00520 [Chloroflexi bacterium]|nr:hypothetical protein [Chloroflexota bacterium]